jgi:hypothetical protein
MHATELCGSSVALAIAEDMINLHDPSASEVGVARAHGRDVARHALLRCAAHLARRRRSCPQARTLRALEPVDKRLHKGHAYWKRTTSTATGTSATCAGVRRRRAGRAARSSRRDGASACPRIRRRTTSYIPRGASRTSTAAGSRTRTFLSDNQYDFNRNFPYSWAPEHEQAGAGDFPGSAPRRARSSTSPSRTRTSSRG